VSFVAYQSVEALLLLQLSAAFLFWLRNEKASAICIALALISSLKFDSLKLTS
jgi:hypothetical protein